MTNQTTQVEKVSDVIQVMKAGVDFYQEALSKVESESIKNTFRKMIANKRSAIEELQPYAVAEQGEREDGTSWAVDARKLYTAVLSIFSNDEDHTYVDQLEEVEDKVLEVLDEAISKDQPANALITLRSIQARAQTQHDEMKALQIATS